MRKGATGHNFSKRVSVNRNLNRSGSPMNGQIVEKTSINETFRIRGSNTRISQAARERHDHKRSAESTHVFDQSYTPMEPSMHVSKEYQNFHRRLEVGPN